MLKLLRWIIVALGLLATGGTGLSFSRHQHWFVRLWDFPRVQLALCGAVAGGLFARFFSRGRPADRAFLLGTAAAVVWQARKIRPYTRCTRVRVQRSRRSSRDDRERGAATFRLLISNVMMENREHHRLLEVIRASAPDVVLALETDAAWAAALRSLDTDFPHVFQHPRENHYGLVLLSRLRLMGPRIQFLVQHDIPSVHTGVELPSGDCIYLHGLHPRPPEPIRHQDSTPRDAELVVLGKAIRDGGPRPTVVAGDLNDVAWSDTSELFLRLSGLLDPRMGRGFYNSYHADYRLLRYPLDHVFHSNHFRLVDLQRLPHIGSDHFPMLIELSYEPEAENEQKPTPEEKGDEQEADEKLESQAEAASTGDDRPTEE
ncbi:MAG: endonuclease/exonuclease/phosphatase family protein [Chthoniobacterales bacterium]|nr:endonuclease/exonuclease/phosphatase family protein [Chthoniobacterales bacterium]